MSSRSLLTFYLSLMVILVTYALWAPQAFVSILQRPSLYLHAKFVHILSVTLLFANAVIGTIWEARSLRNGGTEIIRYTYQTVVWIDAVFTSPLILIALLSGIMLGTLLGGVGSIGWVSVALFLFAFSGLVWLLADIPLQYRVNRLFARIEKDEESLPANLKHLLWLRMVINVFSLIPLLVIFFLMVHKPQLPTVATWWRTF